MTDKTKSRKANAILFSAIMLVSVIAVGFAVTPAAANVDNITAKSADAVNVGGSSFDQNVTYNVTLNTTSQENNITINTSQLTDITPTSATSTITNDGGNVNVTINGTAVDSNDDVNVTIGNASSNLQEVEVTTTITYDTSNSVLTSAGDSSTLGFTSNTTAATGSVTFTRRYATSDAARTTGTDRVYNGTTVYQGEDDLTFFDNDGSTVEPATLEGSAGNNEGVLLQVPTTDSPEGTYAADPNNPGSSFSVTVLEPRISTAEVRLGGNDISSVNIDDANNTTSTTFEAYAEYNFNDAENISVTVEDSTGADITDQVTTNGATIANDKSGIGLDMTGEDAGEYTVIFEGAGDLDFGSGVEEYTFTLTDSQAVEIGTASDSVTQGDNLQYTISGGTNAEQHLVTINSDEFNSGSFDGSDFAKIFRNVDDTEVRGIINGTGGQFNVSDNNDAALDGVGTIDYAYAVVEMDGTQAVGSIDTSALDDSSIDVKVYNGSSNAVSDANPSNYTEEDDVSFTVNEGDVTLDSPTDTYTVGQEVDVNGTASSADRVGLYVRDNNEWEPVSVTGNDGSKDQIINVDSDNTFEETDVVISNIGASTNPGSNILAFPGRYDIGVVDMSDVSDTGSLNTSVFSSASTSRYSITVESGDLTAEFGTVNGQIAEEDGLINVEGTAPGQNEVVIAFVDSRGNVENTTTTVESDDTFSEEDISLGNLDQGPVSAHVISLGRDSQSGDGSGTVGNSASGVSNYVGGLSGSGDQVRSRIISNTVDADGSDDLIVSETFRLTDASISVNSVYPDAAQAEGVNPVATGETMIVEGDTNRRSDDASVTLDVLDENQDPIASGDTDEWANDGQFSVSVDTGNLEPGTYVVEVDDGESSDRVNIEIVEERDTGAQEEEQAQEDTTEEEQTQEDTSEDTSGGDMSEEQTQEDTSSEEESSSSSEEESTDDSTPGFGALVALVALVAAALLATRRRDE